MLQEYPGFIGGSYTSQSPIADCEETINWYVEVLESQGAKSRAALYPTPGARVFATTNQSTGQAMFSTAASGGRTFGIIGMRLCEFFIDGSVTYRGNVAISNIPATICTNGDGGGQLLITSGGNAYSYDLTTNTLTAIAALAGKATQGGFAYGYGLVFERATATVWMSDLFDFTVFDPTQFFQGSIGADAWYAMCVTSWGQIFLPGTKTRSYWGNTGEFPIPFAPFASGLQSEGIAATFGVKEGGGALAWLATSADGGYTVMTAEGYRGKRLSNHAVEFALSQMARVDDCIVEAYTDQGHTFFLFKFPTTGITWCVDLSNGLWHQRGTWQPTRNTYTAWRPTYHCFAFNKHLWADSDSGTVYQTDISFPLDVDDLVIRRVRTAPSICRNHEMLDFGRFELLMQVGVGNTVNPGATPMIVKQRSNDGGITWGSERACGVGAIGQYHTRVMWEQNGSSRDRAERIIATDPINNWRIVNAFYDISGEFGRAA